MMGVLRRLLRARDGATVVEIALGLPILMFLSLGGMEIVNLALLHMRLNQLAITVADNASRAKQTLVGGAPRMREYDVNDVFRGAELESGDIDFGARGRIILSSLETNADGGQWIHWQRCYGVNAYAPIYGLEGAGSAGTAFAGMGQAGDVMTADTDSAIMFVEVAYRYTPLFMTGVMDEKVIRKEAAVYVRDDRDLTQIYNPSPAAPVSSC